MVQTSTTKANLSHEERTATEPRDNALHAVIVENITPVNSQIRTFRFTVKDKSGIKFLPGQWLDVHVPGIEKAGGFTITSTPRYAVPSPVDPEHKPFLELAIQKSPDNPPAAWLWQLEEDVLGKELAVRVGGSFVWPPPDMNIEDITRAVFIAGGVGINPLMSMLSHVCVEDRPSLEVRVLYSTRLPSNNPKRSEVLFLPRIIELLQNRRASKWRSVLDLFLTGTWDGSPLSLHDDFVRSFQPHNGLQDVPIIPWDKRIDTKILGSALGMHDKRRSSVFYICGPPDMTDSIVEFLRKQPGIAAKRIFCEKWW